MKLQKQQSNFLGIKIVIATIVVIIAAYLGYVFYTTYKANTKETVSAEVEDVQPAPAITQPSDLDKAATTIEQAEVESSNMDDMTEIEKELSEF